MVSMKIILESRDELRVIELAEVLYLRASRNYTDFFFSDGRTRSELLNLSAVEVKIKECARREGVENPFIRLGRSLLVNKNYVETVSMKLQRIGFRTTPPTYLKATKNTLVFLKQALSFDF